MSFKVRIKNIGKLVDDEIRIGDFTVFAGPNNTGKSFVSKILYSLFDAMNANHAESHLRHLVGPVRRAAHRLLRRDVTDEEDKLISLLLEKIEKIESFAKGSLIEEGNEVIIGLLEQAGDMLEIARNILELPLTSGPAGLRSALIDSIIKMVDDLHNLSKILGERDISKFISIGMTHKIEENLTKNFQIPEFIDLQGDKSTLSEVSIEEFGELEFGDDTIEFRIHGSLVKQPQLYSRVIYLESPIYWKLKDALEDIGYSLGLPPRREREWLSGVPGYFYDLVRALKSEYTGNMAFPEVYKKLTSKGVIGGKIAITENGDLSFQENGRSFSLPVTAMGITNLGILALLIERKVLDEDTFLFIDEPEAHLHPAWQVIMAEALFELARQGVNVVIATHSIDILKWLEVRVKKNPEDERLVALNQFPVNNSESAEDFETKIENIKEELTKPFSDLYLEGL